MKYNYNAYSGPSKKIILLVSIIVVISIIGILFSGGITGMATAENEQDNQNYYEDLEVENGYEETSCKMIEEVYTELEPYTKTECISDYYVENICETNELNYTLSKSLYSTNNGLTLNTKCIITNTGGTEGDFVVEIGIINKDETRITEQQIVSVYPHTTEELKYSIDIDMGSPYCNVVDIPTREVCYDNITSIEKCYELNKYREVAKVKLVEVC